MPVRSASFSRMKYVLSVVALSLLGGCAVEVLDARYATLRDAEKDGAIARGWIPAWLPRSASNIDESHDLDTNVSVLRAAFESGESWDAPSSCSVIRAEDAKDPAIHRAWWPADVPYGDSGTSRSAPPRHAYFRCNQGASYLAVDRGQGELLYWRPHAG